LAYSSAEGLPKNKALEALIGEYRIMNARSSSILCSLCKDSPFPATNECIACEAPCCETCSAIHLSKPRFSHHKILPIGKSKNLFCLAHMQELSQFCREDKLLICPQCIKKHADHTVIPRSKAEELLKSEIEICKDQLKTLQSTLKENQVKILNMSDVVQSAEEKSLTDLDVLCEKAVDEIIQFKNTTHKKIQETFNGIKLQVLQKQNTLELAEQGLKRLMLVEDGLELLQSSVYYTAIKPISGDVILPAIVFTPQQLPVVELSAPSKFLYYMNRGTTEFYAYNIATKELLVKELPANSPHISRWSSFTTLADGRILVTGGKVERNSGSHRTCMYIDPVKLQYNYGVPMLRGHSSHISLRVMNKVYIISGKNEENICDSFCEVLDTYTENWNPIGRINFPRTCAAGCYLNESIYVLGGFQNAVSNSIEKFSVNLNVWTLLPTLLPEKIWQHGCFALDSKKILVFGGEKDSEEPNKISFIYDTGKEGFSSTTSIENIPVYLYFWIQVIRDEDYLLTINKEKTLVKYSITDNKWSLADLG
jgi:predicted transcriptional regulator